MRTLGTWKWAAARRLILALALAAALFVAAGVATGGQAVPAAHASAQYNPCDITVELGWTSGAAYNSSYGDSAQASIDVWVDSHVRSTVCQELTKVTYTASSCGGGSITEWVSNINVSGGDASQTLLCGQHVYQSNLAYLDGCTEVGYFNASGRLAGEVDRTVC